MSVLIAAVALASCGRSPQEGPTANTGSDLPADQVMLGVVYNITADGVRQARLEADTAILDNDSATVEVRPAHLVIYGEDGSERADLTSEWGRIQMRTQLMVARGNVVLVTRDGDRRIETEELHYDPERDRLWSDVASIITSGGTRVEATGFTADGKLNNLEVRGGGRSRVEGVDLSF